MKKSRKLLTYYRKEALQNMDKFADGEVSLSDYEKARRNDWEAACAKFVESDGSYRAYRSTHVRRLKKKDIGIVKMIEEWLARIDDAFAMLDELESKNKRSTDTAYDAMELDDVAMRFAACGAIRGFILADLHRREKSRPKKTNEKLADLSEFALAEAEVKKRFFGKTSLSGACKRAKSELAKKGIFISVDRLLKKMKHLEKKK